MTSFFPQHFYPRDPVSLLERRELEKKFAAEVPEFSDFFSRKLRCEKTAYIGSAALGALASIPGLKYVHL